MFLEISFAHFPQYEKNPLKPEASYCSYTLIFRTHNQHFSNLAIVRLVCWCKLIVFWGKFSPSRWLTRLNEWIHRGRSLVLLFQDFFVDEWMNEWKVHKVVFYCSNKLWPLTGNSNRRCDLTRFVTFQIASLSQNCCSRIAAIRIVNGESKCHAAKEVW